MCTTQKCRPDSVYVFFTFLWSHAQVNSQHASGADFVREHIRNYVIRFGDFDISLVTNPLPRPKAARLI